jgi:hypothetical protein
MKGGAREHLEHPAAWKFHDFHCDFHAGRSGGVEIRQPKSQGERRLSVHGVSLVARTWADLRE